MDLFRKCMEPVEKCLRDAKMDLWLITECGCVELCSRLNKLMRDYVVSSKSVKHAVICSFLI
ncbi:hypothetical protein HanPI659440_Chr17g0702311 [Helianthus annuus]|nr:hypothetical protein HanPI659440_Chr17g0702311 [Helianthus annuus]